MVEPLPDHFGSREDPGEPLVMLSMTREAATSFLAALGYGAAVAEANAEVNLAPETAATVRERASWLRWGQARLSALVASDETRQS